jgi:uncharacterized protein (DUF1800 family)
MAIFGRCYAQYSSEEFWNAPPKFKRPLDYFVSVLRAVNFEVKNPTLFWRNAGDNLNMMGQVVIYIII